MFRRPTTARRPSFRPACEPLEGRLAPATFTVTNTNASGVGSLSGAIVDANAVPGHDLIRFDIPGAGVKTITGTLPAIRDTVTIDGYSQPGAMPNTLPTGNNALLLIRLHSGGLILFAGSNNSTIRGLIITSSTPNIGIEIDCVTGVRVSGNFIGIDGGGTAAGNVRGVRVGYINPSCGIGNVIGGPDPEDRNVISGNLTGIELFSIGNTVQNNYIGTNAAGTAAVPRPFSMGVVVHSDLNRIGDLRPGTTTYLGNVISGNDKEGVLIHGQSNRLYANYVGTNAAGTAAVPNAGAGIRIDNRSNWVGGSANGQGNLISGNSGSGIEISGPGATGNVVSGNRIGLSAGSTALRNWDHGVLIQDGASGNTVSDNTIAHNGTSVMGFGLGNGVRVAGENTVGNRILGNRIHSNVRLGIDLEPAGVTPNDGLDIDDGPNGLQNFPTVTSALQGDVGMTVSFALHSRPNRSFRIEFFGNDTCDPSGHGEGRTYLTAFTSQTNNVGNLPASQVFVNLRIPPAYVTATATNLDTGDTSEFSECEQVQPDPLSAPGAGDGWMADLLLADEIDAAVVSGHPADRQADARRADAFWVEYRAAADGATTPALRRVPSPRRAELAEAIRLDGGL